MGSQEGGSRPAGTSRGPPVLDGRQIFVGSLGPDMDAEKLRRLFDEIGGITYATIFTDRETGQSKGAGKVEFETLELAQKAVEAMQGRTIEGHDIVCRVMKNGEDRQLRQPKDDQADPECKLFIGSLSVEVTSDQLKDVLGQAGEVVSADIFTTSMGPAGRAIMGSSEEAQRAIEVLHGTFVMDKRITVRHDVVPNERAPKPNLDSMIFVGGLGLDTTAEELREHFTKIGDILHVSLFTDKLTGRPRGSGKIEFLSPLLAQRAMEEMNESELAGRRLQVKVMEARVPGESGAVRSAPGLRPPRENDGRQIFFGGLGPTTTTDSLRAFASRAGETIYANVFVDRETGQSKGAGKVEFQTLECAERAIELLDGAMLDGQNVLVKKLGEDRGPPCPDGRTVFVGSLSWDIGSEDLRVFASQLGEVTYATVFFDKDTGKSKGSGKVQFASPELAEQAVLELSGRQLMGREVAVRLMDERR